MLIQDKLQQPCKKIEPLYFVEITEGNTIAYITKKNKTYDFSTKHNEAHLFNNPNEITTIKLLNNLNYTIINFNDIFIPRYEIILTNPILTSSKIDITTSWCLNTADDMEYLNSIKTTNLQKAQEKLQYLIYLKTSELQNEIAKLNDIKISIPSLVNLT